MKTLHEASSKTKFIPTFTHQLDPALLDLLDELLSADQLGAGLGGLPLQLLGGGEHHDLFLDGVRVELVRDRHHLAELFQVSVLEEQEEKSDRLSSALEKPCKFACMPLFTVFEALRSNSILAWMSSSSLSSSGG